MSHLAVLFTLRSVIRSAHGRKHPPRFTLALTIWLKVNKQIEPPKSVHRLNRDGWYSSRAQELAANVFRSYDVTVKPELQKYIDTSG